MNYKLFAFDLDGTLLNSSKEVSKINIDALKELSQKDCQIVVCTGRPLSTAMLIINKLEKPHWTITCNGAVIKDISKNNIILNQKMNNLIALKVLDILKRYDIYFHVIINDIIHTEKLESLSLEFWENNKKLDNNNKIEIKIDKDIGDFIKTSEEQITKFIIISKDKVKLLNIRSLIQEIKEVDVVSSGVDNFEIMPKGVSKGNALRFLADFLKVSKEDIVAIGDNENDISMIEFAGLGIAMGNSENNIKKKANKITLTNNENGVAFAIYNYILLRRDERDGNVICRETKKSKNRNKDNTK